MTKSKESFPVLGIFVGLAVVFVIGPAIRNASVVSRDTPQEDKYPGYEYLERMQNGNDYYGKVSSDSTETGLKVQLISERPGRDNRFPEYTVNCKAGLIKHEGMWKTIKEDTLGELLKEKYC